MRPELVLMVLISRIDHSREPTLELERMKIKCFKFECSECGEPSSIQVFYRKDGSVGYARARHKNTQGFYYHKQSIEYVMEKLRDLCKLDQGQYNSNKTINSNLPNSSFNSRLLAGGEGFEPSTPNLGGWCSIRTEHRERVWLGPLYSPKFPVQQFT